MTRLYTKVTRAGNAVCLQKFTAYEKHFYFQFFEKICFL